MKQLQKLKSHDSQVTKDLTFYNILMLNFLQLK